MVVIIGHYTHESELENWDKNTFVSGGGRLHPASTKPYNILAFKAKAAMETLQAKS
jgi:hypothetical protein